MFEASVVLRKTAGNRCEASDFRLESYDASEKNELGEVVAVSASLEDRKMELPLKYEDSFVPSKGRADLGPDYEEKAMRFNVRIGGRNFFCRKLNPSEADAEHLSKLKDMRIARGRGGFKEVSFPNAPGWSGKYLGGGEEKDIFLVVDDKRRAFCLDFRHLIPGKSGSRSISMFTDIARVQTTVYANDGRSERRIIKGFHVREYEPGHVGGEIDFIENPDQPWKRAVNAAFSIPHRLAGGLMVRMKKFGYEGQMEFAKGESHGGNFMVAESDRRTDEYGVKYPLPMPVIRAGEDGKSRLRIRWFRARAIELTQD